MTDSLTPPLSRSPLPTKGRSLTLAVIGDVHDQWDTHDEQALRHLGVDLVLLVGDFGNEAVSVVRSVAEMALPKAVILGNHDAWHTATVWGRRKCPYDRKLEDRVQQQLDLLGAAHVGYGKLDLPDLGLSIVGSRPFSWGGPDWRNKSFYRDRYGVESFAASVEKIGAATQQTSEEVVIFMGHCGPAGLGDRPESPCGRDWLPMGGDYGDPDFTGAIAQAKQWGKSVPLVAFGHMHHSLRHTKKRLRERLVRQDNTVYLNAASVPRIVATDAGWLRNMSLVTLENGVVTRAAIAWVDPTYTIQQEDVLYAADPVLP
ncbi:MAG TPA: TIGR04168 family protein [Candidatus Obscuribacterales bacterium]